MRILAIDTALGACAAAVLDSRAGAILASESAAMVRGHAEAVMPLIARVMDAGRCEFHDLDRIAVTVGPGSFTGLRVGIAAARGIALAAGKPAVGLSTLSTLAAALPKHEANALLKAGETVIRAVEKLARRSVANRQLLEHELAVIDQVMRIAHRGDRSTYAGSGTYHESPIAILDARA